MNQNSTLDFILGQKREAEEQKNKRIYGSYIRTLLGQIKNGEKCALSAIETPMPCPDGSFVCLREPLHFLRCFEDVSNSQEACRKRFEELIRNRDTRVVEQVIRAETKESDMWFGSTSSGINLRPGLQDNETTKPTVVTFGKPDDNVHALIVGATGSGKSVFLHNLIFSLMAEYSPWEINIFLVDFKKVSLSKYLSACDTPHIKAVAATSEVRYVISLMEYLNMCMQARQTLFSYLGLEKLSQIRERFGVVLPRCLLLVDEFQQMFTDVTLRQENRIKEILTAITKLGRATGYHLVFASQEMSGTLGNSAFANFKVRFALRCQSDISSTFLGNDAAARIGNRERGIVIENSVDGKEENNRTFKVPFVEEDDGYFTEFLLNQTRLAETVGFKSVHKYYQEDFIRPFSDLEELLNDKRIVNYKRHIMENNPMCFDILTLGDAVVFNFMKNDCETVFLEVGTKKNIGVYSPKVSDIIYICRLLATNFKLSPNAVHYRHKLLLRNDLISRNYDFANALSCPENRIYHSDSALVNMLKTVQRRKQEYLLIQEFEFCDSLERFANEAYRKLSEFKDSGYELFDPQMIEPYLNGKDIKNIPEIIAQISAERPEISAESLGVLIRLYRIHCQKVRYVDVVEPCVFWVIGTELLDRLPRDAEKLLAEATDYGVLFIFAAAAEFPDFSVVFKNCDYLFLAGNQEKIYNNLDVQYTYRNENSIVIDFKVRSAGVQRSFKKYYLKENEVELPKIDFDKVLAENLNDGM